jgi:glutathione S-transferase
MYLLHYAPDNASLIVRLALEALGLPYRTRLVDRRIREQDSPAFRVLNPVGVIPVLETPDGPLSETAAVLLWLGDRNGRLVPAQDDQDRGAFLKWLLFSSNTLHADLRLLFYPESYAGESLAAQRALHQGASGRMVRHLALLEHEVGRGHHWLGARGPIPSALDLYLAVILRWCALYARHGTGWFDLRATPGLAGMAARIEAQPCCQRAAKAEGLGTRPFTAPVPCRPPEGSAV